MFFRPSVLPFTGCLLALLLSPPGAFLYAQDTGSLEGHVLKSDTQAPLVDVNVVAHRDDLQRGAATNAEGYYRIDDLPAGHYQIIASVVGYGRSTQDVEVRPGETATANFELDVQRYGLGEVVVSAVRREEQLAAIPASVTVLAPEELDRQTSLTSDLGAVLAQGIPGLAPSTGTLSNYGQTLRGREAFILIDGVPQSTPLRNALRDLRTIDLSAIERVEVMRGASALYGYGATGGAINIVTKRPAEEAVDAMTEIGLRFSPKAFEDSFSGRLMQGVSGHRGNVDYVLSGSYESWGYFFDAEGDRIPQDPHGQGGLAGADERNLLFKGGLQLAHDQRLELSANYYNFRQNIEYVTAPGTVDEEKAAAQAVDEAPGKDPGTENAIASLRYTHDDLSGSRLSAQAFVQDYATRFGYLEDFGQTILTSTKAGVRLDVETPLPFATGTTLLWGLDALHDVTEQPLEDGNTYVPPIRQLSAAPFAQVKLPLGQHVLLRGGARYETIGLDVDDFTTLGGNEVEGGMLHYDALAFNTGAVVYPTSNLELFASFAQGFSVADVGRELRATEASAVEQLNPKAQTVNSYKLGARAGTGIVEASLTGFVNTSDLGATFSDFPELEIIRSPERIRGLEATLDVQPIPAASVGGTATLVEGKRDADDDGNYETYLPGERIPPLKLTGYVSYAPTNRWQNRLQVLYSGTRDRFEGSNVFGKGSVDAYTTVDLYSAFETELGTFKLGIENLLDAFYFPTISEWYNLGSGYSAAPGRQLSLTYAVRW